MSVDVKAIALQISNANSTFQLRSVREKWHLELENNPPSESIISFMQDVNSIHDLFIRRAIFLAEQNVLARGMVSPSLHYAFLLLGSGGREEQTPWSDQDNAIVYDDRNVAMTDEIRQYFLALGNEIVEQLKKIGYPPCEGEVGAHNERWVMPYTKWIKTFNEWFGEPNWENIRYVLIASDLRCVYGNEQLATELKNHIVHYSDTHHVILEAMLNNTLRHKIVLNVFGHFLVEPYGEHAGCIDIKYGGYIPIINVIRLFAIVAGVTESSSLKRIQALYEHGQLTQEQQENWTEALMTVLELRMKTSFEIIDDHYSTSGMMKLKTMNKDMQLKLKTALKYGQKLQRHVQKRINNMGG
jgi:CBS domain-containing protein